MTAGRRLGRRDEARSAYEAAMALTQQKVEPLHCEQNRRISDVGALLRVTFPHLFKSGVQVIQDFQYRLGKIHAFLSILP